MNMVAISLGGSRGFFVKEGGEGRILRILGAEMGKIAETISDY